MSLDQASGPARPDPAERGPVVPDPVERDPADRGQAVRRRTRLVIAGASVIAVGAAGIAVAATARRPAPAAGPALPTEPVVRADLATRQQVDGVLGYGDARPILGHGGTITGLPAVGATIRRGQAVYRVDGRGVPLWYGRSPLWRTMRPGSRGADVRQLQRNLAALGYRCPVDGRLGPATATAVQRWWRDRGLAPAPGDRARRRSVRPGDVVVAAGPIRIAAVRGVLGGPAQGTVVTATGTRRVVTVNLPVDQQRLAVADARVSVALPGGVAATGHITSLGTVATAPQAAAQGANAAPAQPAQPGQAAQNATIEVEVTLDRVTAAGRLDGAPVTVGFTGSVRRGVLAVPVSALVALGPDAYAVKVVGPDGTRRSVPVRLGMFTGGRVEVSGPGVAEGVRVEVPASW
jgi:peptidoglycan hydrolase-like protein with peptidoglycan-binding domain